MIRFDRVTKKYPNGTVALHDLNFRINEGEFISIVGRSGAGKSTLLRLITAEDAPTAGKVYIEGIDISTVKKRNLPLLRKKIGVVFQDIKLLPAKTAFENVAYAMEVNGASPEEIERTVPRLLEIVGLGTRLRTFPNEMSGGENQRVAIARALAHEPVLILADEPTGNLDEINSLEILDILMKINRMGTTVLLATHDKELVNKVKKRVIVIDEGGVISDIKRGKYKLNS